MSRVTIEDMLTAAEWLDINEGTDGEMESCHRVSDWLEAEAKRRAKANDKRALIRSLAKRQGVSEKVVRAAMTKVRKDIQSAKREPDD